MAEDAASLSAPTSGLSTEANRFEIQTPGEPEPADIKELRQGFRQGFVFELIDITKPNPEKVHVMVLNPTAYNLSEPFQLTLTPAEDDTVVSEENGIIVREITLEGTYGLRDKVARGFLGAQGGGQAISGEQHFEALRNLFREYSTLKKDANRSANIRLVFHALRDDDHFIVVPRVFETPRTAKITRTHHSYRITMAAIGEADAITPEPDTSGFDFTDALRDINEGVNDARAAFAELTADVSAIKRKVANIQAVLGNAAQVINAVSAFVSGTTALINFPLQLVATITEQLANAGDRLIETTPPFVVADVFGENTRSLRRMEAAFDIISMYDDKFNAEVERVEDLFNGERNLTNADVQAGEGATSPTEDGSGGSTIGSATRGVSGSDGRTAGLEIPRDTGLQTVRVARTDSLESIAALVGTTPEAIIIINDLRSPYLTVSGGPGIAKPGDLLLVPAKPQAGDVTGRGAVDYLTAEEAMYGVDLNIDRVKLRKTGKLDFRVDTARDSLDGEFTRGIQNVVQGTQITVFTERGTTVFLPDIGLRRNVGTKGTLQHVLLASLTLREALLADPRISGIQSSQVVLDGDVLSQEITPIVSGQRPGATLVLPFGRAAGGSE